MLQLFIKLKRRRLRPGEAGICPVKLSVSRRAKSGKVGYPSMGRMHYLKLFLINALAINSTKQSIKGGGEGEGRLSGKVCEIFKAFLSFFCFLFFLFGFDAIVRRTLVVN